MLERVPVTSETDVEALRAEIAQLRAELTAVRQESPCTQALLSHLQAGVVVCSASGQILYANPTARRILGRDDLEGADALSPVWEMQHPDGRSLEPMEHPVAQVISSRQPVLDCHLTMRRPDGAQRWVAINALPVLDGQDKLRQVAATFLDLTYDEMAMRNAALARETMTRLVKAAPIGICVTDETGVFEQVNPHYCNLYGYDHQELVGCHFTKLLPPDHREAKSRLHELFIQGRGDSQEEMQVLTRHGEQKTVLADAVRITGDDGRPKKVSFVVDISHRIKLEQALRRSNEELQHLAITDGLTGLYNRRHIIGRLEEELRRTRRYQAPLSVFLFDLDHFKSINDTYGHAVGDKVLVKVSAMLRQELRGVDLIARYGGEEFLIVLPNVAHPATWAVAERLRLATRELEFGVPGLRVSLSGGVMQAMADETVERIIQRADMCLYSAKSAGRDQIRGN